MSAVEAATGGVTVSADLTKREPPTLEAKPQDSASLDVFIQRALADPNFDTNKIDILERLLKVKREMESDRRRELFFESLARVQAQAPRIAQNGLMDRGPGKGQIPYAKREDIDAMLRPIYQAEGFTVTWDAPINENRIQVIGRFTAHGHTETREWSCSPDTSGGKQPPQAAGSTISYGQRYISKMFWDVIEVGADTNGAKTEDVTAIDQKQAEEIRVRMNNLPQSKPGFLLSKLCEKYGVKSPEEIRLSQVDLVMKDVAATEASKKAK